jgi:AraC-like DNA-binding protein
MIRGVWSAAHVPPPALRPYVGQAHGYRVPANPTGLHRGLPSRHLTLVVELAAPLRVDGLGGAVAAHGVVGGLHTGAARIDASHPQEGLQYALTPPAAGALLGHPAGELRDLAVDLADLLGAEGACLVRRLQETESWQERFALVDAALLRRLDHGARVALAGGAEVAEAWRVITGTGGRARVETVARHVGWSRRHLSERFRAATGLTPKETARIVRFETARRLLTSPSRPTAADVAALAGYADQSHLAREWRALAGCSVSTWLREELPFVQADSAEAAADSLS